MCLGVVTWQPQPGVTEAREILLAHICTCTRRGLHSCVSRALLETQEVTRLHKWGSLADPSLWTAETQPQQLAAGRARPTCHLLITLWPIVEC